MTANEMAVELELELDRSSSNGSPGYEDLELTSILTKAERLYVKKFIDKKNNRKGESLEETEIRSQGLSALIQRGALLPLSTSQVGVLTNGQFFDLPEDFMYCLHEDATINKNQCGTELEALTGITTLITADIKVIAHDEITRLRKNKYKKPFYKSHGDALVWRLVFSRIEDGYDPSTPATDKRHQLVSGDDFAVSTYSISYLKQPKGIIVDQSTPTNQRNCILDESTHRVIIDIAKSLMMNRVKEQEISNIESLRDLE